VTTDEPATCHTLGCENPPGESGYCAECTNISPSILNSDDTDTLEKGHRASDVSDEAKEPESEAIESPDSGSDSPMEGGSGNTNPSFEAGESTANDQPEHEQAHAVAATPQHAPDERGQRGGPR
jgi:hypothetical protein